MKIKLKNEEITLDPEHLIFDENNLNEFLKKSSGWYFYYSSKFSECQEELHATEDKYDEIFSSKFVFYKTRTASSDKLSESSVRSDDEVIMMAEKVRHAKRNLSYINGYLKALDKATTNALNLGYNIRKEMTKLNPVVKDFFEEIT